MLINITGVVLVFLLGEMQIVRRLKEKLGYVAPNLEEEVKNYANSTVSESTYELPDGQTIQVGDEKCRCTEPSLIQPY